MPSHSTPINTMKTPPTGMGLRHGRRSRPRSKNGSRNNQSDQNSGIKNTPMTVRHPSQYFSHWNIGRKYHSGRGI